MAAMSTASDAAPPAPLPDAEPMPTMSGTKKAIEKTGPIKPTDCAIVSISFSFLFPPSKVFAVLSVAMLPPMST